MKVPPVKSSVVTSQAPSIRADLVGSTTSNDPWEAAQNLAFMKRSSPASHLEKRSSATDASNGEIVSIPSLTSSSDGTTASPGDSLSTHRMTINEDKAGVDAMLLAAVAMTEFINSPPPSQQYLDTLEKSAKPIKSEHGHHYNGRDVDEIVPSVSGHGWNDRMHQGETVSNAKVQESKRRRSPQVKRHLDFDSTSTCSEEELRKRAKP
jgi:hypothetical protein